MSYRRVIPRDLFNEGNLLNCLGRLWLALNEDHVGDHRAELVHEGGEFEVLQDPSDGSISCSTVSLNVAGEAVTLFRPLNSREPWPLWARFGLLSAHFEDVQVFDANGLLTDEFQALIVAAPEEELDPDRLREDQEERRRLAAEEG